MPKVFLKKHVQGKNFVIAAADEDLIGKQFQENNRKLNVSTSFYRGDLIEMENAIGILKNARNINLIGNNIVMAAIQARIIHELAVIKIQGIAHAIKFIL